MSGDNIAIRVKNVKKSYRQYKTNMQKIRFLLLMREAGEKIDVLQGVSFDIKRGEKVGIIGQQQSGKSTLMRILAGIIRPDSGKVRVQGGIAPILDIRLGFDGIMTGRDNYLMMSTALGRSKEEIKDLEEGVFDFAGLKEEMDEPVRTYKKGAAGRLGFAIATAVRNNIVLFDANMSFGSKAWNDACFERLKEFISGDTTFVMVVNRLKDASELCDRGIVLYEGQVVFDGTYQEAVSYFRKNCRQKTPNQEQEDPDEFQAEKSALEDNSSEEDNENGQR